MLSYEVTWLTDSELPVMKFDFSQGKCVQLSSPVCSHISQGEIHKIPLNLRAVVSQARYRVRSEAAGKTIPVVAFQGELVEPILAIQSVRSGRVAIHERYAQTELDLHGDMMAFQHVDRLDFSLHLDGNDDVQLTRLIIEKSALRKLMGSEIAEILLNKLDISHSSSARCWHIPSHISAILDNCLPGHLMGGVRVLYAQSKVMEYLCALAVYAMSNRVQPPQTRKHKVVLKVYEELLGMEGKLPSLSELASRHGMCGKTLNKEFKRVFGHSVHEFMVDYRFNQAHSVILESDTPIKALAARLGYSHVNHFITAFKRKFGYSPGSLRRAHQ